MRFRVSAFLLTAAALAGPAVRADEAKPVKVLLVVGGGYHDYEKQKKILADGLAERAHVEVTVVHQGGSAEDAKIPLYEREGWAEGYDVVIHNECFAGVKDKDWLNRILAPHKAGKPAVVVHCSMHCYRAGNDDWFEFCGVTSRRHGAAYAHEVLNRQADHPVMQGFGPAWANPKGELYWIEKLWPGVTPLASSKNQENGKDEVCAWAHTYKDKARVFGTTLGHHNETVADPKFLDLVTRGTLWAAGKLDDQHLKPRVAKLVPENLAAGAKATASSAQPENPIPAAFDGNPGTRWAGVDPKPGHWLQADLGKPSKATGCRIDWEFDRVYQYKVEGSADGKEWKTLVDAAKNTTAAGPYSHKFEADVRYVKVTHLGSHWPSIRELEVFGTEMVPERQGDPSRAAEKNVLGAVKPAEGFEATAFAAPPAVNYPVFVSAAPDGTLYVASDGNGSLGRDPHRGRVVRLRDLDGDGRADESKLFVADLDSPRGMVWDQDRLYVLHPPHISAFIDKDGDGVADEQKVLVKDIAFNLKDRPADHTSNGLTLGADGWLYAAIGDFGFLKATGADGRTLQLRGGGVVRVRPDGTGLELFTSGTRNILEVALSPLLDGFARDNTNDGGGWDVRFHHFTGLEDHGYPRLYKNFADEAITPLADYGGGSGCGAAWLDDPGLPAAWNNRPFTSDWGRDVVYAHPVTASGSTFAEKSPPAEFVRLPRPTDLDIDAAGRVYVCSWRGGQFTWAGPDVGFIVRVTPKGFKPRAVPDFAKASDGELVKLLEDGSHRVRLEAQRRLLRHGLTDETTKALEGLASDKARSLATRVAALFALKQGLGEKSHAFLVRLADDPTVAAWAVRALTDHEGQLKDVPAEVLRKAAGSEDARTRREGIIALARLGDPANAADIAARLGDADGVIAHTAAHALARLRAVDACLAVLEKGTPTARRWAARALALMHDKRAVDGLVRLVEAQKDRGRRAEPLAALCRLYHREGDWKGDSWGTRPDTRGPYYQPEPWAETDRIGKVLLAQLDAADADEIVVLGKELARNRVPVGDPTGRLIELAKKSSEAARVLAREMADAPTVPPAAVPLLVELVRDDAGPSAAAGIVALAKADSADGVRASVHALTRLRPGDDANRAVRAFLTSPFLGRHVALLTETARTASPEPALWADAALLRLAAAPAADDARATAAKAFADDWKEPKRRSAILAAAARTGDRSRAGEIVAALDDADPGVRKAAADAVAKLALDPKRVKEVLAASGPKIGTMKPEAAVEAAEAGRGEAWRGEQLFVKLNCVACHTVSPEQPLRGPYLGTIAKTYRRKALAESILLPNKTIAQGFATNVFNLNDGRTLTGFVTQEAADKVTVRDNTGKEWVLPKKDIDERTKSPLSVMPEGLAAELTVTDFASLLDYLEALAAERGKP